jgi:hypothetical protein
MVSETVKKKKNLHRTSQREAFTSMMSDLAGTCISIPKIDWDSSNLPDAWRKFQHHVELIF